jgi:hypothetical protein
MPSATGDERKDFIVITAGRIIITAFIYVVASLV